MHYNKCISLMIEFYNSCSDKVCIDDCLIFLKLLHPIAPYISEYLYQKIKEKIASISDSTLNPVLPYLSQEITDQPKYTLNTLKDSILEETWPVYDETLLVSDFLKVTITLNGKLKRVLEVNKDICDSKLKEIAFDVLNIEKEKILIIRAKDKIIVNGILWPYLVLTFSDKDYIIIRGYKNHIRLSLSK